MSSNDKEQIPWAVLKNVIYSPGNSRKNGISKLCRMVGTTDDGVDYDKTEETTDYSLMEGPSDDIVYSSRTRKTFKRLKILHWSFPLQFAFFCFFHRNFDLFASK